MTDDDDLEDIKRKAEDALDGIMGGRDYALVFTGDALLDPDAEQERYWYVKSKYSSLFTIIGLLKCAMHDMLQDWEETA